MNFSYLNHSVLRGMRWEGHVARLGERRNADSALVGKHEGKRQSGRSRCRWKTNIKTNFKEIGCEGVKWIHLAQDRDKWWEFVNRIIILRVP
jgi:hypothetical protein